MGNRISKSSLSVRWINSCFNVYAFSSKEGKTNAYYHDYLASRETETKTLGKRPPKREQVVEGELERHYSVGV